MVRDYIPASGAVCARTDAINSRVEHAVAAPSSTLAESSEVRLALACARRSLNPVQSALVRETAARELDGQALLSFCRRHGLAPLTHWHVEHFCPGLQREWFAHLGAESQQTLQWNLHLTAELRRLLTLFGEREIPVLVYKGPTLGERFYGHLGLRVSEDLDLLIRRADLARAAACMKEQGYLPEYDLSGDALVQHERNACESNFVEPRNGTLVELHWQVLPPTLAIHFDEELLWSWPQGAELQGFQYLAPRPETLLLALSAHAAKHMWSRISWLADVAELIRAQQIDWDLAWNAAARIRMRRILGVTLLLVEPLLERALPAGALPFSSAAQQRLAEEINAANLQPSPAAPDRWGWFGFHLSLQDDWYGRVRFLARKLGSVGARTPRANPGIAAARAALD